MDKQQLAFLIWAVYYHETRSFDQRVCTNTSSGLPLPSNVYEACASIGNALDWRNMIDWAAYHYKIQSPDWRKGQEWAAELTLDALSSIASKDYYKKVKFEIENLINVGESNE